MKRKMEKGEQQGLERLRSVVAKVSRPLEENGTHFCAGMRPTDLLGFIRSEIDEVKEELALIDSVAKDSKVKNLRGLRGELGDVLFDTLLLIDKCSREFGDGDGAAGALSVDSVAHAAALKVEGRCPYAFKEGTEKPPTLELERKAWNDAKEREKRREAALAAAQA